MKPPRRDPFGPSQPGRKCCFCGRGGSCAAYSGAIRALVEAGYNRFAASVAHRRFAHLRCFNAARRRLSHDQG